MTPIRWSDRISGLQIRYESGTVHESHFFLARPCNSVFCGQSTVLQLTHTHTHTKRILDLKIEDNVLVSVSSGPSRSIGPLGHHPRWVRPSHRPMFIFGVVCIRCNECRMGAWGGHQASPAASEEEETEFDPAEVTGPVSWVTGASAPGLGRGQRSLGSLIPLDRGACRHRAQFVKRWRGDPGGLLLASLAKHGS